MLVLDSVQKTYGGVQVLHDVHLQIKVGEIAGVLGRNGAGKSTLLKIIAGCIPYDFRYLRIDDKVIIGNRGLAHSIGLLTSDSFFPSRLKPHRVLELLPKQNRTSLTKFIEGGLGSTNDSFGRLSFGQRKTFAVLFVLSLNKQYILLDEPFSGLSPVHCDFLQEHINNAKKDKGILIVDHSYHRVVELSQSLYLMNKGSLKPVNSPQKLFDLGYLPSKKIG